MTKRTRDRAVAYLRVSTDEQRRHGWGLPAQERSVRSFAKANGLRVIEVLADEGVSGSNGLDARVGLPDAMARLEAGEAEVLLVPALDRLARDLIVQETTIQRLKLLGCRVESATEPDVDSDVPERVFVRQVFGALAQLDRARIVRRMIAGKDAKRKTGGYVGGRPGYGKRADRETRTLVANPEEERTIVRARELRAAGRSFREIGEALTVEGHATKGGGPWHAPTVRRLIVNTE